MKLFSFLNEEIDKNISIYKNKEILKLNQDPIEKENKIIKTKEVLLIGSNSHDHIHEFNNYEIYIYNDYNILFGLKDIKESKTKKTKITDLPLEIKNKEVFFNNKKINLVYTLTTLSRELNDILLSLEFKNVLTTILELSNLIDFIIEIRVNEMNHFIYLDMIKVLSEYNIKRFILSNISKNQINLNSKSFLDDIKNKIKIQIIKDITEFKAF